jgi:DNA-binding transcriptional ArsR family regulator
MMAADKREAVMTVQAGISRIAALLADPAREAMVTALLEGTALPAGELARIAGLSAPAASAHLNKLVDGGLLAVWPQGRFRYFRLADEAVAGAIETLANLAARPRPPAPVLKRVSAEFRTARRCYNHLAGECGVALADRLAERGHIAVAGRNVAWTASGAEWLRETGLADGSRPKRLTLRLCLDWTERRPHLAGPGAIALLSGLLECRLLRPIPGERALRVTPAGRAWFRDLDRAA